MFNGNRNRKCTVQHENGTDFCDMDAKPELPFPMCGRHALRLFRHMADALDAAQDDYGFQTADNKRARNYRSQRAASDRREVVYYLLIDGLVKIGYTGNLKQRLKAYPPHAHLLGTETGGLDVELLRHYDFREHLVAGREWFAPSPALREHVESLTNYRSAA